MSNFVDRVAELKKSRHCLQKDIPEALGISLRSWIYYENGERLPRLDVLLALADFFDVSLDYLVGRTDDPSRPPPASE